MFKIKYFHFCIVAFVGCFLASCSKDDASAGHGDIYIAGNERSGKFPVAKYWKNGIGVALTDGNSLADATAITVVGNDVYVAGFVDENYRVVAKYWKNGVPVTISDRTYSSYAQSICVLGNDVYVCGYEVQPDFFSTIKKLKFWKNGTSIQLPIGDTESWATCVQALHEYDYYVVGTEYNKDLFAVAKIWAYGSKSNLSDGTFNAVATDIEIVGKDSYIAGEKHFQIEPFEVFYWKNLVLHNLPGSKYFEQGSICVDNSDVYVAASYDIQMGSKAAYWKNDTIVPIDVAGDRVEVNDIAVRNKDVYLVGRRKSHAAYWKNGVHFALPTSPKDLSSTANAIFITK